MTNEYINMHKPMIIIVILSVFVALLMVMPSGLSGSVGSSNSPLTSNLSSVQPYTAYNSAGSYVVEPNGTYFWEGHYLRSPPVPYPTVPIIAPDGLPYGAINSGPIGQVGAKSFSKGLPQIKGVSPNTTVGGLTTINTNTYWGNETITLVGNVSVSGGSLTIYNSNITFDETLNSTLYEYGIYTTNAEPLYVEHGSIINSTLPSKNNGFYISINSYLGNGAVIDITNTTVLELSKINHSPALSSQYDEITPVVVATSFDYSTFIGSNSTTWALNQGVYSSAPTGVFYVNHSLIKYAVVQAYNPSNDTFVNSVEHWSFDSDYVNSIGLYYDNFGNMNFNNTSSMAYQWSLSQPTVIIAHSVFPNITDKISDDKQHFYPLLYFFTGGDLSVSNTTFNHITLINNNSTNVPITIFASEGSSNITFNHITVNNFETGGDTSSALYFSNGLGINNFNFTNSYWKGFTILQKGIIYMQAGPFQFLAKHFNIKNNIFTDFNAYDNFQPSFGAYAFHQADPGDKLRSATLYSTINQNGNFSYNWLINDTGQSSLMNMIGYGIRNITNNTIINVTSGGPALAFAKNSPTNAKYFTISSNSIYGLYNYSGGIGDSLGGVKNATYGHNIFYDVDTTSYDYLGVTSNGAFNNYTGNVFLTNTNGTYEGNYTQSAYKNLTSIFSFTNDTITNISLNALLVPWINPNSQTYVNVIPNAFNLTFDNSYIPSTFFMLNGLNGDKSSSYSLFSYGYGTSYDLKSPYGNSNFITLNGYLGVFKNEEYNLNLSEVKGENNLPVYYSGNQVAKFPDSGHYNFTVNSQNEYSISTTSKDNGNVMMTFWGMTNNQNYNIYGMNGNTIFYSTTATPVNGSVSVQFDPQTMPLDPIFFVTKNLNPNTIYTVNSNQPLLPLNFNNNTTAIFPEGYTYTFEYNSQSQYTITAQNKSAGSVTLTFWGLTPGKTYNVSGYNVTYTTFSPFFKSEQIASQDGSISITYNPKTMPLDPIFSISPASTIVPILVHKVNVVLVAKILGISMIFILLIVVVIRRGGGNTNPGEHKI